MLEGFVFFGFIFKLIGVENYRGWKRVMDINFLIKWKLGFVIGMIIWFIDIILVD